MDKHNLLIRWGQWRSGTCNKLITYVKDLFLSLRARAITLSPRILMKSLTILQARRNETYGREIEGRKVFFIEACLCSLCSFRHAYFIKDL
jgi:hypothetical protein